MVFSTKEEKLAPGYKKIRRSLLYVPICDEEAITKSLSTEADLVMYDMEDTVPLDLKIESREKILSILELPRSSRSEIGVRINSIGSGYELDDLYAVLKSDKVSVLLIPKVESPSDLHFVTNVINTVASEAVRSRVTLIAAIETSLAMMNIKEIASCCNRLDTLMFAVHDYCISAEITRSAKTPELYYARSLVSNAAHAYGLECIDMINTDQVTEEAFKDECLAGYRMGFSGKQAICENQIYTIHVSYCPDPETVKKAIQKFKFTIFRIFIGQGVSLEEQESAESTLILFLNKENIHYSKPFLARHFLELV
ncbi:Citrate lyase subunit beta-like protein, mitochondrial [Smittium culicis]|uniref:Citrate lyase subunit beta-like protein, mitochondrial n=1 Tax=Smittium culicis TaxID=133412 RepID=A0A1R1YJD3_9FUNG|nr:Citrate lyase subunit beta-like protein, mitochondrial [Smittium culicis]